MFRTVVIGVLCWSFGISVSVVRAQDPEPLGPSFQVNSYTTGSQIWSTVATAGDGSFWVVWRSSDSIGTDSDGSSIQARRFTSAGASIGAEIQVNSLTTGDQSFPDAEIGPEGELVVTWSHLDGPSGDGDGAGIRGKRIFSDGSQSTDIQINTITTGNQSGSRVSVAGDGSFLVVWGGGDVYGRWFGSDGSPIGSEIRINQEPLDPKSVYSIDRDVTAVGAGEFVVAWTEYDYLEQTSGVRGSRWNTLGEPIGQEMAIRDVLFGPNTDIGNVVVDSDSRGNFHVVWRHLAIASPTEEIWARSFDAQGSALSDARRVDETWSGLSSRPAVAAVDGGTFVVSWSHYDFYGPSADGDLGGIVAKLLSTQGPGASSELVVNDYTTNSQQSPSLGVDRNGNLVATWMSFGSHGDDLDGFSIQGRRFSNPALLFADGFESGDSSAWN